MKNLKGACMFAQSGGPTSVINSSAAGVFLEALKSPEITKVYGAAHGIKGVLDEQFYDIGLEDKKELELLKYTPSSALGSVRYKLKDVSVDDTDYKRILEVFKKYDIRYFFYNGGNDSMDTCNKISKFLNGSGWDCNVIGVPKTIDNDLFGTDHCPGFASAAKYIATTLMEINLDAKVYNTGMVCVIEVMGRNAGWLTAAASLAGYKGLGADLIYLPEVAFDVDKFVSDVEGVLAKNDNKCIAVVSEGIKPLRSRSARRRRPDARKRHQRKNRHQNPRNRTQPYAALRRAPRFQSGRRGSFRRRRGSSQSGGFRRNRQNGLLRKGYVHRPLRLQIQASASGTCGQHRKNRSFGLDNEQRHRAFRQIRRIRSASHSGRRKSSARRRTSAFCKT